MAILNYNGKSKSSGVYVIFNNLNWRVYVGSCKEFKTRWSYSCGHLSTLQKNVHKNKFLQADYNKCKLLTENDDFLEFHILEDLPNSTKAERLVAEEKWIAIHYGNRNRCYNMVKKPTSSEGCIQKTGKQHHNYGRKASEETKEKLRKAMLERKHLPNPNKGRKLSEEHRLKIIERLKGNKYSLGYVHSAETLKKRRVATLGKRLGIPLTEEHKKKLSEAKKGKRQKEKLEIAIKAKDTLLKIVKNSVKHAKEKRQATRQRKT